MKNFLKTILISVIFITPSVVFGADLFIETKKDSFKIGEQFIVSVSVISEKENPINAVDFNFGFSQDTLKFINSIERDSIISFFVERPKFENGKIVLSGINPGSFYGIIDPVVDPNEIRPVKIIDFIFEPISSGRAEITLLSGQMYRADGSGLTVVFNTWPKILNIENVVLESKIDLNDTNPPLPFEIEIIKDENIKGSLLIFDTKDEESGIDYFEVLEVGRNPVVAESPYVLKNQPPKGIITVRAYDKAGNMQQSSIEIPEEKRINIVGIIVIISIVVLFIISRKRKKK